MIPATLPQVEVRPDIFPLVGGLDLHTPHLAFPPGAAREGVNYEVSTSGGCTRVAGYERFDGRPSPSAAGFGVLELSAVGGLAVGDAINGATSGATAVVAAVTQDPNHVVYTKLVGSFVDGENLLEGATVVGAITSSGVAITDRYTAASHLFAATNVYRADIGAVPGSGPVRGGFEFKGLKYAFRDNLLGTASALYRASGSGWTLVALPYEVGFTGGSGTPPAEGATVTQGGVSTTVRRVVLQSGTWGAGNAIGRLVIDAPTGGAFAVGAFSTGITANASTASAQVTLLPGGRFETDVGNAGNGVRVYGVDGVNRGWEFDGAYLVPLHTGMASDAPTHVKVHKKHVVFAFGPSIQHSGVGTPYSWTVLAGAAEMLVDDDITGFIALPSDASTAALAVLTLDQIHVLYGTSSANWNLVPLNRGAGARAHTAQALGQAYVLDDGGVVAIESVQAYGNFDAPRLTDRVRRFLNERTALTVASLTLRDKQQYRVFFSDGFALFATIVGGKYKGAFPVSFPNPVACTWLGTDPNGRECGYFGSTNGFVYRMDIGTSFDGQPIDHNFVLAFAFQKTPRIEKTFKSGSLELQGDSYVEFNLGYLLGYGDDEIDQPEVTLPMAVRTTAVFWDAFVWDDFHWDGKVLTPSEFEIDGTAINISLAVEGSSALWPSFTVNSVALDYILRRRTHRV